ncbi:Uncharacterised protein [Klebsiella pneumoniae]|nr:Uncharacterised protein [Klebsiella pneumoniae]
MIDSAISQNNQTNWYIGIVYCGEATNFEVVYSSSDTDFLTFFVSQNSIIKARIVINPDHTTTVAHIGCFE